MPRALKSDKFFIYAPKKHGRRKGQMLLGIHTPDAEPSVQDLLDFLKGKGISPSRIPLSLNFMAYVRPEDKYPPISPGTAVKTTKPNLALREEWSDEGWASKKPGVRGTVITHHDSHGLCYDVRHEDGSVGCYDPSELKFV